MDLTRAIATGTLLTALALPATALAGGTRTADTDHAQHDHAHQQHAARHAGCSEQHWVERFGTWTPDRPEADISDEDVAGRYGWAYRPALFDEAHWAAVAAGEIVEDEALAGPYGETRGSAADTRHATVEYGREGYWTERFGTWTPEQPDAGISGEDIAARYGWAYRPALLEETYRASTAREDLQAPVASDTTMQGIYELEDEGRVVIVD